MTDEFNPADYEEAAPKPPVTILGPAVSYVTILNHETSEHLKRESEADTKYNPLRPSSAGKCTRELAYALNEFVGNAKYPKEIKTPDTHRLLNLGHSIEYHVLKEFRERTGSYFEIRYKQQVLSFFKVGEPDQGKLHRWIEGSLDLCFVSDLHKGIGDVKSKKEKYSSYYASDWDEYNEKFSKMSTLVPIGDDNTGWYADDLDAFLDELNDPFFAQNFWQLNFYALNPFITERGIDHGFILQYNKNVSKMREIRFRPSQKLYERTRAKFELATRAVATNDLDLATRDHLLGSIKCAFCDYRKTCWNVEPGDEDPIKAFFRTLPKKAWPTDITRIENQEQRQSLGALYEAYKKVKTDEKETKAIETEIVQAMIEANVRKIKFEDNHVYEIKALKNSIELRRGKV